MDPPYQEFELQKLARHGKENGLLGRAASILGDRNRVVVRGPYGQIRLNFHPISKSAITADGDDYRCVIEMNT